MAVKILDEETETNMTGKKKKKDVIIAIIIIQLPIGMQFAF